MIGKATRFGFCFLATVGCAGGTSAVSNSSPSADTATEGSTPSDGPSEEDAAADASFAAEATTALGIGAESCASTVPGGQLGLERTPNYSTVFKHANSTCDALPVGSFFRNTGDTPLVIQGIGVSSTDFSIESVALPKELQPGESITVQVAYRGASLEPEEESLTITTSSGCSRYSIRGFAVADDTVVTRTPTALDFGEVKVGIPSETQEVLILAQLDESKAAPEFGEFSASPEGAVELLEHPEDPITANDCQKLKLSVRIPSQETPGPVAGTLFFAMTTERAHGVVTIEVFATAVE